MYITAILPISVRLIVWEHNCQGYIIGHSLFQGLFWDTVEGIFPKVYILQLLSYWEVDTLASDSLPLVSHCKFCSIMIRYYQVSETGCITVWHFSLLPVRQLNTYGRRIEGDSYMSILRMTEDSSRRQEVIKVILWHKLPFGSLVEHRCRKGLKRKKLFFSGGPPSKNLQTGSEQEVASWKVVCATSPPALVHIST